MFDARHRHQLLESGATVAAKRSIDLNRSPLSGRLQIGTGHSDRATRQLKDVTGPRANPYEIGRGDGTVITQFRGDKVRALLVYLAVESDRPHSRAHLCGLLWPEQGDEAALANLSTTLARLRSALSDNNGGAPVLLATRQTIQWNGESGSLSSPSMPPKPRYSATRTFRPSARSFSACRMFIRDAMLEALPWK